MGVSKSNSGADLVIDTNKNVNWMDSRGFWTFYALLLGSLYMATPVLVPSPHQWTFVNVLHGIVRTWMCVCVCAICVHIVCWWRWTQARTRALSLLRFVVCSYFVCLSVRMSQWRLS